jgi:hypothetical protein
VAYGTLNGSPVLSATIGLPRVGAWHADVSLAGSVAPAGACTLAIDGGLTLRGTVLRADVWLETVKLRMVAGAGGLGRPARPRHYRQTRLSIVLADLLKTAGETLAPDADPETLALTFGSWTTIAEPVGALVSALLGDDRLPSSTIAWRMKPDGTFWLGQESWPDSGLTNVLDYQELDHDNAEGSLVVSMESLSLLPGTMLDGRRISYVEHMLAEERVRTKAWAER